MGMSRQWKRFMGAVAVIFVTSVVLLLTVESDQVVTVGTDEVVQNELSVASFEEKMGDDRAFERAEEEEERREGGTASPPADFLTDAGAEVGAEENQSYIETEREGEDELFGEKEETEPGWQTEEPETVSEAGGDGEGDVAEATESEAEAAVDTSSNPLNWLSRALPSMPPMPVQQATESRPPVTPAIAKADAQKVAQANRRAAVPHAEGVSEVTYEEKDVQCVTPASIPGRCLPSMVIAGFAKGGTAQLRQDLGRCHPQVVAAKNEVNGLRHAVSNPQTYMNMLPMVTPEDNKLLIEASPSYASLGGDVLDYIAGSLQDIKVVMLMRDPVARDFSHFRMHTRNGQMFHEDRQRCFDDLSQCMVEVLVHRVLTLTREWVTCEAQRSGGPAKTPVLGKLTSEEEVENWIACVEENPRVSWSAGPLTSLIEPYVTVVERFRHSFGDRLLLLRSEDFFHVVSSPQALQDVMDHIGLDNYEGLAECFVSEGDMKAAPNQEAERVAGIHVTPMSDQLVRLLVAMRRPSVEKLEELENTKFMWPSFV